MMPANRFFIDNDLKVETVFLEGPEHHHLIHVMRLGIGEKIELVNGRGKLASGKITETSKKQAKIEILGVSHFEELTPRILLAVPFMRVSKLEWVVEKGTELGAGAFLFYPAKYSEKEDFSPRQLERLHLLSIAALKQSGRLYLPSIEVLPDISSLFVKEADFLFGDPKASATIDCSSFKSSTVAFISGPEKGFSVEELSSLKKKAKGVILSPYILRAETAPIAAASILGMGLKA
jgi:16S rRNA (uracil1498-N3)-methyltransferase